MRGFQCECGCGLLFELDQDWLDGDDLRKNEHQFVLHPACQNVEQFKFIAVGNTFLVVESLN